MSEIKEFKVIDEKEVTLEDGTKQKLIYVMATPEETPKKRTYVAKVAKKGKHDKKRGFIRRGWDRLNEKFEESSPLTKTFVTCAAGGAIAGGISIAAKAAGGFVKGITEGIHGGDQAALPAGETIIEVDPIVE